MEKIVKNAVMKFLNENSQLSKHQHGFRNGKSCTTNLLALDILFIDFEKAFGKVPHKLLLHKLSKYGIKDKLLKWFESFLKNRRQRVVLGEAVLEESLPYLY